MVGRERSYPGLEELLNEVADLRPLGAVAARILEITEGDRFSAHELAQVVATDQALSAKMLRLANSAYYGFPRRISTVRDAVVLLGFRAVRSSTLASCVIDAMPGSNTLDYRAFWHFSVTVGMLAEVLARSSKEHLDEAFTAGVMHNIGRLALDQHLPQALREAVDHARTHDTTVHEAQRHILGFSDVELGGALVLHWSFPEPLVDAVRSHALPLEALPSRENLAAHVVRARALARSHSFPDGVERAPRSDPPVEWTVPPLSVALKQSGGVSGVLERADAFLESALAR